MNIKKNHLLALIFTMFIGTTGLAQESKVSTRSECTRKCNAGALSKPKFGSVLIKIREEIAKETDPEKLKLLLQKEKEELERATEKVADFCEFVCKDNPE